MPTRGRLAEWLRGPGECEGGAGGIATRYVWGTEVWDGGCNPPHVQRLPEAVRVPPVARGREREPGAQHLAVELRAADAKSGLSLEHGSYAECTGRARGRWLLRVMWVLGVGGLRALGCWASHPTLTELSSTHSGQSQSLTRNFIGRVFMFCLCMPHHTVHALYSRV